MIVDVLPDEERLSMRATHRVRVFASDLTQSAANTAQVLALMPLGLGQIVTNVYAKLMTRFANSADAAFNTTTVSVGDNESATQFLAATETNANGAAVRFAAGAASGAKVYQGADSVNATFNAMAAKALDQLNEGEIHFFLQMVWANEYDAPVTW